jgi:small subunit ribosomal protein S6
MERRFSMRTYETIFIAHPDLVEEEVKALIDRMKGIIENLNGQLIKVEEWGRKRLAYKLKKLTKGYYVLIRFLGNGEILVEIERNLRLSDGVLKYQSIRLDMEALEKIESLQETRPPVEAAKPPEEEKPPVKETPEGEPSESEAPEGEKTGLVEGDENKKEVEN